MPRDTLKLPPKSDAEKAAARSSPHRPIRGGSKPAYGPKPPPVAKPPRAADNRGKQSTSDARRAENRPPPAAGGKKPPSDARRAEKQPTGGASSPWPNAVRSPTKPPRPSASPVGSTEPTPRPTTTASPWPKRDESPRPDAAPSRPDTTPRRREAGPRPDTAPRRADSRPAQKPGARPIWPGVSQTGAPPAKRPTARAPATPRREPPPTAAPRREAPAPTAPRSDAPTAAAARPTGTRGNPSEPPRLSKRMSELGLCSRREADEWIENGWVRVDGVVIDTLGSRVAPHATIEVDPAAKLHQAESVTMLINKPIGYVSGQAEDGHEPASVLLRPENRWPDDGTPTRFKIAHLRGLAPAGRLDIDSTGLLVFTQDGRVAKRLIGENSTVEKEYLVRVEGQLSDSGMKLLQHGLELDGVKLKPAQVSWQNEDQLRIVLREGRKRQIRRMCEQVGLQVTGLKRVRIGSVVLGKLPIGQWRYLRFDEKF